jgi:hypothetical protein
MSEYDPLDGSTDYFRPPPLSIIVHCLHCNEEYDSYRIEWRVEKDPDGKSHGFWCCPIEGCDGKGFGFDIFPIDPEYRDEHGDLMWMEDDDESDDDEAEADEEFDDQLPSNGNGSNGSNHEDPIGDIGEDEIPW